tara:strand:- start:156 stop:530 length:375 start_codon:yes stop_codon:yes gene_type:complete
MDMSQEHDGPSMALIVRKDLRLSAGKVAVQCSHAAVSCALIAKKSEPRIMERWQSSGGRKISLGIDNIDLLKEIMGKAKSAGLITHLVKDAGHTEVSPGTITVLGIGPAPKSSISALTGELKPY